MKKTVSVFIPAYNEERNVKKLLEQILSQSQNNFILEKILVVSDASIDNTVSEISEVKSTIIETISNEKRMGKWYGFTIAQKKLKSDIIVSLDADTEIIQNIFLDLIIKTLQTTDITSTRIIPKKPLTFFQKIMFTGAKFAQELFEENRPQTDLYLCHGRCIATNINCFMSIEWQDTYGTDAYMFLSAIKKKFKFSYSGHTDICYTLPKTVRDYINQSARASSALKRMEYLFKDLEVKKLTKINTWLLFVKIIKFLVFFPITFPCYLIIVLLSRIRKPYKQTTSLWNIAESTK